MEGQQYPSAYHVWQILPSSLNSLKDLLLFLEKQSWSLTFRLPVKILREPTIFSKFSILDFEHVCKFLCNLLNRNTVNIPEYQD